MNKQFNNETGRASFFNIPNIDTDSIIPQTELLTMTKTGLGDGLFARWRYHHDRVENPDFILNQSQNRKSKFILAENNFGCGSSREHAVWALIDYGICAVISTKFGEIFYRNSINNGLLPALVSSEDFQSLAKEAETNGNGIELTIKLKDQSICTSSHCIAFDIDAYDKERLLKGLDNIGETLAYQQAIEAFCHEDRVLRPWVYDTQWI